MTAFFQLNATTGDFETAAGDRIIPVGVNYWPASCGVEMWPHWPSAEIQADLALTRALGLNCVRFFLRWQDFEPAVGIYEERMFARLDDLLRWHREQGLLAHPTLFVGYMSGGIFWPEWHAGRNVFSDPALRARAIAFTEKVSAICAHYPETVLAIDLGNELGCLPECAAAKPAEVASWCADMSAAIRRKFPAALVVSGSEQTQVNMDVGWRFGAQPGCDFYSMHTYPVSTWHSLAFDGMTDPLAQSLLPFYVKCAKAWGPVMAQEFGTLLTRGQNECDTYLRAVLPACRAAGANGFLWWCLRDISFPGHPYDKFAFEGQLGLVDATNQVKPSLRYFIEFAQQLLAAKKSTKNSKRSSTAIYWPREYYLRDNPRNPGNDPGALSRQLAVAHFALDQIGTNPRLVRSADDLAATDVLAIAGAKLTATEIDQLLLWVQGGGRLIFQGPDALTWGAGLEKLLGAEPLDFRAPHKRTIEWNNDSWTFTLFPRDIFLTVRLTSSQLLAADENANPVLFRHTLGRGAVITCMADIDREFAATSNQRETRARWLSWYRSLLAATG
ncbi:glycoside hydrolase 5 family protein [Oleiharenicola lentus]|uniref:glycoside hydrolase 5 family protein n=1 Tax=Oleiharenicola lentus TaxID=2508720 RepID=UPI003F661182